MRDTQRLAVYRWGDMLREAWPHLAKQLSIFDVRTVIGHVWFFERLDEQKPQVEEGRGRAHYDPSTHTIFVPAGWRTLYTAYHEAAHALIEHGSTSPMGHGPKFTTLLLNLLVRYASIPQMPAYCMGLGIRPRAVRFEINYSPTRCGYAS